MFRRHVCWDERSAKAILRPLALEGNEAIFRATHSAITGLVVGGPQAHEVAQSTEEGLLAALAGAGQQHAMCVVEGEAGSGKSHLIRWLKVHWPSPSDVVVLIERSDGTLDGTLRQLQQKLSTSAAANVSAVVPQSSCRTRASRGPSCPNSKR